MSITVLANGKAVPLTEGATVADLVVALGLAGKTVAVERNGDALLRVEHATTPLADGDVVEIVKAVAGG